MAKKRAKKKRATEKATEDAAQEALLLGAAISDARRAARMAQLTEDAANMWKTAMTAPTKSDPKAEVSELLIQLFIDGASIAELVEATGSTADFIEGLIRECLYPTTSEKD